MRGGVFLYGVQPQWLIGEHYALGGESDSTPTLFIGCRVISPIGFGLCPNFPRAMAEIEPPKFLINLARTARSMIC